MPELSSQNQFHLALWLTTLLQSPAPELPSNYTQHNQYSNRISIYTIHQYLSHLKKPPTESILLFILGYLLDMGIICMRKEQQEKYINSTLSRQFKNYLKQVRKELQIQYHRQKLIFTKRLKQIPPYHLFKELDNKKLGYITIQTINQYIHSIVPTLPITIPNHIIIKLANNIHYQGQTENNNKVYLQNFTQLIQRIGSQDGPYVGSIKYIKDYIDSQHIRRTQHSLNQEYEYYKQLREKQKLQQFKDQLYYLKEITSQIKDIGQDQSQQSQKCKSIVKIADNRNNKSDNFETFVTKKLNKENGKKKKKEKDRQINDLGATVKISNFKTIQQKQSETNYQNKPIQKIQSDNKIEQIVQQDKNIETLIKDTHRQIILNDKLVEEVIKNGQILSQNRVQMDKCLKQIHTQNYDTLKKDIRIKNNQQKITNRIYQPLAQITTLQNNIIRRDAHIRNQLQMIKLERVKNRINMYINC